MGLLEIIVKYMFEAKNDTDRAEAFKSAFQLLETKPHKEGPSI